MSSEPVVSAQSSAAQIGTLGVIEAEMLASVPPMDDSGANTADRYDWQAAMAAADGLALYRDALSDEGQLRPGCTDHVICEWHEDWALLSDGRVELVSGKHRDASAGAYTTIVKLADDGGVAHLFNRWAALKETPSCRLVTSGGLSSGPPQDLLAAAGYFRLLRASGKPIVADAEHAGVIAKLREAIPKYCNDTSRRWEGQGSSTVVAVQARDDEIARFLSALTIADSQVQRDHVHYAAPAMYVQPVLDRMNVTASASAVWEAVLSVFRVRMRARGPLPTGGLPLVLQREEDSSSIPIEIQRTVAARTVTMYDIETAIAAALAVPGAYEPLPPMPWTTRLPVKMKVGRCSDNAIERALSLRIDYQDYWRERESGDPVARAERKRLERLLQRISDQATTHMSLEQGSVFWHQLQAKVGSLGKDELPAGMDSDVALGGVCDLTNRCKVWFGSRFDVETVIARIRARLETEA